MGKRSNLLKNPYFVIIYYRYSKRYSKKLRYYSRFIMELCYMFGRKKKKNPKSVGMENKDVSSSCEEECVCDTCENSRHLLENCNQELMQTKEQLVRVTADLQNFKKRVDKERVQWAYIAQSDLIQDILSIIDNFDRALAQKNQEDLSPELAAFLDGFAMISKSLYKFLEKYKVTEITQIKNFDPNFHEAISQIDFPDYTSGEIIEVIQKGFMFKDKVLRPAKVVVAK